MNDTPKWPDPYAPHVERARKAYTLARSSIPITSKEAATILEALVERSGHAGRKTAHLLTGYYCGPEGVYAMVGGALAESAKAVLDALNKRLAERSIPIARRMLVEDDDDGLWVADHHLTRVEVGELFELLDRWLATGKLAVEKSEAVNLKLTTGS